MNYVCKPGDYISDVVLNSTGGISNWDAITAANFFSEWVPDLYAGQSLVIPDTVTVNNQNLSALQAYPANNRSVSDVYTQIASFFTLLESAVPIPSENVLPVVDKTVYYNVRPLETIGDAVLNGSGNFQNLDLITQALFSDTWTPTLLPGQQVPIPTSVVMDLNNYRALNAYPANNHSIADVYDQIDAFFALLGGDLWILRYGYWLDAPSQWEDTAHWIDG